MTTYNAKTDHRSRLIAGLAKVLESKSLPELYVDDIAREAGVSKRTFYQHFSNKQSCFLALYEENSAHIVAKLLEATANEALSINERVELGAEAYLTAMQAQAPLMKRLYIDIIALGSEGLAARRRVIDLFVQRITEMYEKEQALLPGLPNLPDDMLTGIIAGLNELILFRIEDGKEDELIDLASTTRALIMAGVQMMMANRT